MSFDTARDRLNTLARREASEPILARFAAEPDRLSRLSLDACGLHLDLSKQSWGLAGFEAALDLARAGRRYAAALGPIQCGRLAPAPPKPFLQ